MKPKTIQESADDLLDHLNTLNPGVPIHLFWGIISHRFTTMSEAKEYLCPAVYDGYQVIQAPYDAGLIAKVKSDLENDQA